MAHQVKCTHCNKVTDCQKKGTNAAGYQRYRCSECGMGFVSGEKSKSVKSKVKKTKKEAVKTIKKVMSKGGSQKTKIYVNSNEIKTVNKRLTEDQAFDMISDYFREVTKTNVERTDKDGVVEYSFKVNTGKKG